MQDILDEVKREAVHGERPVTVAELLKPKRGGRRSGSIKAYSGRQFESKRRKH